MTQPTIELSVVLPAYNEGDAIHRAAERCVRDLSALDVAFEVVLVNDGSKDDTLAHARRAAAQWPQVRVLDNPKNLGQVGSILRGFAESLGASVMHNGVDLPFDPRDTPGILDLLRDGADVVVVERIDRVAYGAVRKLMSWGNVCLLRWLAGSPFRDHNFVQAYRRSALDAIAVESTGVSTVTPELILKARALGFDVRRTTAEYHERTHGKSTITMRKVLRTVRELLRLVGILRRFRRACGKQVASLPVADSAMDASRTGR